MVKPGQAAATTYLWGTDDPFPMHVNFLLMALGCLAVAHVVLLAPESAPAIDAGCSVRSLRTAIAATVAYFFAYYQLLGQQTALKVILRSQNPTAHRTAERIAMNTLEQMGPFLVVTWLFAVYVDADLAGRLGLLHAASVLVYAAGYAYYGHFTVLVEAGTQPRYAAICYAACALLRAAYWPKGPTLRALLPKERAPLAAVLFGAEMAFTMPGWMVLGLPLAKLNVSNNPDRSE